MARDDASTALYTVRGRRRNGTITYLCPDADWALRKLKDFERAGYDDIAIVGRDGAPVGETELARRAGAARSEPAER